MADSLETNEIELNFHLLTYLLARVWNDARGHELGQWVSGSGAVSVQVSRGLTSIMENL